MRKQTSETRAVRVHIGAGEQPAAAGCKQLRVGVVRECETWTKRPQGRRTSGRKPIRNIRHRRHPQYDIVWARSRHPRVRHIRTREMVTYTSLSWTRQTAQNAEITAKKILRARTAVAATKLARNACGYAYSHYLYFGARERQTNLSRQSLCSTGRSIKL